MSLSNFTFYTKSNQRSLLLIALKLLRRNDQKFVTSSPVKMSRPKVLITRPDIPAAGLNLLKEQCDVVLWEKPEPIPKSVLLSKIQNMDGVYCLLTDKIDEEVLNAAGPQLKSCGFYVSWF